MAGPLAGLKIIEIATIGPVPFAAMMLADHGAQVIRVDRPGAEWDKNDPLLRSRQSVVLDLKSDQGRESLRALVADADGMLEGFRPGVMERLDLGPDALLAINPSLVYARMTGWGQSGPLAHLAGHDINYISITGALAAIGRDGQAPVPPLNLVGDFGGGAMMLAFGMLAALLNVRGGGKGQVIDCAMTDGSALLMNMIWGFFANGTWGEKRGQNILDSGAPFYDVYETANGEFISLGSIEPYFNAAMLNVVGLADNPLFNEQNDPSLWPAQKRVLATVIKQRTRDEWSASFAGADACFAPVMGLGEAHTHSHNVARGTFIEVGGVRQAAPAPRYSGTPCDPPRAPCQPGLDQNLAETATLAR